MSLEYRWPPAALALIPGALAARDYTVAFASFAPLAEDVFIAAGDGSEPVPLAPHSALDYNASFSADGGHVFFTSEREGSGHAPDRLDVVDGAHVLGLHDDGDLAVRRTQVLAERDARAVSPPRTSTRSRTSQSKATTRSRARNARSPSVRSRLVDRCGRSGNVRNFCV
jgi:hypothetical protein